MPRRAALILAVTAALVAACSSGQPADTLPTGGPTAPVTGAPSSAASTGPAPPGGQLVVVGSTPPTDQVKAAVFADYVTFWQRDMIALITNDLQRAGVLDYLFGAQAATTISYIGDRRKRRVRSLGVLRIAPAVISAAGRSAQVRDCLDQTGMYDVNGAGKRTALPAKVPLSVGLVRTPDNRWRVSQLTRTTDPLCR